MKFITLLLLLPLIWVAVLLVRWLLGSGFKSRDAAAKDDTAAMRWENEQQLARQRLEDDKKALREQDEADRHAQRNEQVYPVHEKSQEHHQPKSHHPKKLP